MTQLTVTLTAEPVMMGLVGVQIDAIELGVDTNIDVATVIEPNELGELLLQGGDEYTLSIYEPATTSVSISFDSTRGVEYLESSAAVSVFGGILIAQVADTFETINRNLKALPYSIQYSGDLISSITYELPAAEQITKQFGYQSNVLTTITLSGDVPGGIDLTKTLTYTSGRLTEVSYS